ncbi:MAG: phosphodiesterase [Bacilli bacterium]|nr:phosphodiesterase [Bacilli bacterium]
MKLLFFSDIHGIPTNLNIIEKVINNYHFNQIVVLGDLYYSGPNYDGKEEVASKEVKDFLNKYKDKLLVIKGNCDADVDLKASDFPICDLALINDNGNHIYCTHGHKYSYQKKEKFNYKGILVYGHEHTPYIKKEENMIYICVGSISLPRNMSKPTYMIYQDGYFIIYDINGNEVSSILVDR